MQSEGEDENRLLSAEHTAVLMSSISCEKLRADVEDYPSSVQRRQDRPWNGSRGAMATLREERSFATDAARVLPAQAGDVVRYRGGATGVAGSSSGEASGTLDTAVPPKRHHAAQEERLVHVVAVAVLSLSIVLVLLTLLVFHLGMPETMSGDLARPEWGVMAQ